ncbi:BMC domain-containing protein [Enterococcus asini]|uniref:BMC domain-containing protein n=1 Tax=Enterococcus asini TaxID=57732 RepID=UPI0028908E3E|nr:BMC domain-containing protein [Enterococcus asini]MDT2757746.1 BMC domain-containing protein [Enterococcus asini]
MKALGMIEVRGFLGAVSAADAALKAADVDLNNAEVIRGGLTTVELVGDVAAVEAAVDAGVAVAESLNCLISHHVIARLDPQTQIVTTAKKKDTAVQTPAVTEEKTKPLAQESVSDEPVAEISATAETVSPTETVAKEQPVQATAKTLQELAAAAIEPAELTKAETARKKLLKEKVVNLRKQAYKMDLQHFEKSQIKFANKQTLVDAIMAEIERSDHDWN